MDLAGGEPASAAFCRIPTGQAWADVLALPDEVLDDIPPRHRFNGWIGAVFGLRREGADDERLV